MTGVTSPFSTERLIEAQRAALRVGDGRGFVVEHRNRLGWNERIIITAAQVIAHAILGNETEGLPSCHPARYLNEETLAALRKPQDLDQMDLGRRSRPWIHR
jgi:hypothetical protein